MGTRRLAIVLAALAPACSLFVSIDELSGGSASDGGANDGASGDGGNATDSGPFGATDGGVDANIDAGGNAYVAAILADAPIGYWRFEETSGGTARDEIGAHDGTFVGGYTQGVTGIEGHAAMFDGTSACVSVGGGSTFLFANEAPFSVEAWVSTPTTRAPIGWIVSTELLNPSPYPRYGWSVYVDKNGFADSDGWNADVDSGAFIFGGYSFNSSGSPITAPTWTQIVTTLDSGGHFILYMNGNPRDTSGSTGALSTHAGALSFGCRDASHPAFLYTGSIDEISIYDKMLKANQILAHYEAATAK